MENAIYAFIIYGKITKSSNKILWLVGHLIKCKKEKDMIKLTALVIVQKEYLSLLIIEFNENYKELINNLIPKI